MRTAIYLRVSTEDQAREGFGLDAQLDKCQAMAKVKGWDVAEVYRDEGVSGTLGVLARPGLRALIDAARSKAVDAVIVAALDRLGRKTSIILALTGQLEQLRVELVSCRESLDTSTPTGRFALTLFAALAELDRENQIARMRDGIEASVRAGNVTVGPRPPYGYSLVVTGGRKMGNKTVGGRRDLVINEAEAKVVQTIFNLYVNELYSLPDIASHLDEHKIAKPAPENGRTHLDYWTLGSVDNLLCGEVYTGRWYYKKTQREATGELDANGEKKYRIVARPREEWLYLEVPAIISDGLYKAAQARREANKSIRAKNRKNASALSGLGKCRHCGKAMAGVTKYGRNKSLPYSYYMCGAKHAPGRHGHRCDLPPVRADRVDTAIWNWVSGILFEPDRLREAWEEHSDGRREALRPLANLLEANEARLVKLTAERDRLIDAYTSGQVSLDGLAEKKTQLERQMRDVAQAIAEMRADLEPRMPTAEELETITQYAGRIRRSVGELVHGDVAEQNALYRLVDMKVRFSFEDGRHWLDVECTLGNTRLPTDTTTLGGTGAGYRASKSLPCRPAPRARPRGCPTGDQ